MPDYTAPPTAADIELLLRGTVWWPPEDETEQQQAATEQAILNAAGAAAEFERLTGWDPFVPARPLNEAETRYFDASDAYGVLDLEGGLLTLAAVSVGGATRVLDSDYWLQPANARRRDRPYRSLKFRFAAYGAQRPGQLNRIAVTGLWGYRLEWPADAWRSVLRYGALQTLTTVNQEQDLASISEDGFSESRDVVGVIDPKTVLNEWPKEFQNAVRQYRRGVL